MVEIIDGSVKELADHVGVPVRFVELMLIDICLIYGDLQVALYFFAGAWRDIEKPSLVCERAATVCLLPC